MKVKTAERLLLSAVPNIELVSVLDYKNFYIFSTVPKGVDKKEVRLHIRQPISVRKSDGDVAVFNPLHIDDPDFGEYARENTVYY